jgi:hypothetical protein
VSTPTTPGGVRLLWRLLGSLLAVGALGMATLQTVVQLAHEVETVSAEFEDLDGIDVLEVFVDGGEVRIVGRDTDRIRLTGEINHGLVQTEHRERVDRGRVEISADCPLLLSSFCDVDYTIEVPHDMDVVVRNRDGVARLTSLDGTVVASTDNGRVDVDDVTGPLELSSENGSVRGASIASASVTATTENGSVHLTFREPPDTVVARSENGSVEIVVPDDDTLYRVQTDTDHGSADSAVRTDPTSERVIVATTENGNVTVRY